MTLSDDVVERVARSIYKIAPDLVAWDSLYPTIRDRFRQRARAALEAARYGEPIPMLLYCPQCGQQHIDEPDERSPDWTNPPHRSHLCHDCGCIWRPADVPTTGVAAISTVGKADTWTPERGNAECAILSSIGTQP